MSTLLSNSTEHVPLPHGASDTFWLLFCAALVNFMQVGFAMLETGSVRQKNSMNILVKNLLDVCSGALAWFAFGSSIARDGEGSFFGLDPRSLFNVVEAEEGDDDADGYLLASWSFQFMFAATATTIVSGAMAERTQILALLCSSFLASGLIYPAVARWVWSPKGWLAIANPNATFGGMLDFAGAGVVHLTGGFMSFCGAAIVGPRRERFDAYDRPVNMPGHNAALQVLGTFFLWIGWYGFNPGATLRISTPHISRVAARTVLTTTLSAVAGGLASSIGNKLLLSKTWQVMAVCNGILAGLVSITAGCSVILPPHAILVGAIGGLLHLAFSRLTLHILKVDDPLDAFAVHGGCGLWGLVAAALFASPLYVGSVAVPRPGVLYGDPTLLAAAAVGGLAIVAWVCVASSLLFLGLQRLGLLRVDVQSELIGLDCIEHDGPPPSPPRSPHRMSALAFPEEGSWRLAGQLAPAVEEAPGIASPAPGLANRHIRRMSEPAPCSADYCPSAWYSPPLSPSADYRHPPGFAATPWPPFSSSPCFRDATRGGGGRQRSSGTSSTAGVAGGASGSFGVAGRFLRGGVVGKAASVHGGESWRKPPGGGKQPLYGGRAIQPLPLPSAAMLARASAAGGYALMEERHGAGVQLPNMGGAQQPIRRVGSGSSALSALAARCRASIGHAATVHGASNFEETFNACQTTGV